MEEPNASSVLIYSFASCCASPLLNLFELGRWITFLVAQVVTLANLKKSLGQISGLLVILLLCKLWMFLQTLGFIAAMHDGLFYLHINTSMINSSFHH